MEIRSASRSMRDAVTACLTAVEARDPLVAPVDPDTLLEAELTVAVHDDDVLGLGWLHPTDEGTAIEVRVRPGHRRHGIGRAIFDRLAGTPEPLVATCDAGHRSVRRFLEHRGFELLGILFHQRWDGPTTDVPPAFRTAVLRDEPDGAQALRWLAQFTAGAWPRPSVTAAEIDRGEAFARVAWNEDAPCAVAVGRRVEDALCVDSLGVSPPCRGRGVGRALLCDVMRRAAEADLGVTTRISHLDEDSLQWTQSLGFWTFRTWAWYRREAPALATSVGP